jgi:2-keto-4-pentenoate hydratase/2-oxohepta-3-ene-1,7-dioic acid hydratase in catechol pathway
MSREEGSKRCACVDEATARGNVFGFNCVNDVTALEFLFKDPSFPQWKRSKDFDGFGAFGSASSPAARRSALLPMKPSAKIDIVVDGIGTLFM